nr:IPT/TIG domain-containing protein [Kofleriaceae bacterium]
MSEPQAKPSSAPILQLVAAARRRLRWQGAFNGVTTALIVGSAIALWAVFGTRIELFSAAIGWSLGGVAIGAVIVGGIAGAWRVPSDERIARRIDRASNLADRLSTAVAFASPAGAEPSDDPTTDELRAAAIRDAIAALPKANAKAATPFSRPKDLPIAAGFLVISALAAGLALPPNHATMQLLTVTPDHTPPGTTVMLSGTGFGHPAGGEAPSDVTITVGLDGNQQLATIRRWGDTEITVQIPPTATLGDSAITLFRKQTKVATLPLVIVDAKDSRFHAADAVALEPQDKEYIKSVLADLKATAAKDHVKELDDFVAKVEKMLEMAERGELTKEQMLEQLQKAQEQLQAAPEPNPEDINKQMAETGQQLQKNEVTKALGEALAKNDLEKAKQEMEKLADKLEKQELTPEQQQKLAEQLKDVAEKFEKKQEQKQQQDQKQQKQQQDKVQD